MYQNYNTITSSTPTAILISTASVEEETKTKKRKVCKFLLCKYCITRYCVKGYSSEKFQSFLEVSQWVYISIHCVI